MPSASAARSLWLALPLFAAMSPAHAQSAAVPGQPATAAGDQASLPAVVVEPVQRPRGAKRRPTPRAAARAAPAAATSAGDRARVVVDRPAPGVATTRVKEKYQLPQTTAGLTAAQIADRVNLVDTEDAVKYLPSLFVRKRNAGDTQPTLATRTGGVGWSARSLVYADDILLSALIANNNTLGAPRWGLVAPEEIKRVDFLYGPFSAAYPGNSVGGVLLIETRMPEKLEWSVKQTEAFQTFSGYKTSATYRTDQTSASLGDRIGRFSYFVSANYQNSYSQPLAWITATSVPAGTTGAVAAPSRTGTSAPVLGAGGLLHTEMANVKGKFAYDLTPWVQAVYSIGLWTNDASSNVQSYLRDAAGNVTYGGASGFASSFYTLDQKHLAQSLSVKSDTKGSFDFDLAVSRYDYLEDIQRNPFSVTATGAAFTSYGRIARLDGTNWTNADAKGIWRPNDAHEVSFGLHADRYHLENPTYKTATWNGGPDATSEYYSNARGTTRTLAAWVQDAWRFAPQWKLTVGGRLEDWRAYQGYNLSTSTASATGAITGVVTQQQPELGATKFSPKASLAFEPSAAWLLTASIGQASRFPTVGELYQSSTVGAVPVLPNPTLRPENVLSEELAAEYRLPGGRIRLSLFNENTRDALISQLTTLSDGTGRAASFVTNVEATRTRGVELAGEKADVIARVDVFGSVTYADARIVRDPSFVSTTGTTAEGKRVPNIPLWRATAGVTVRPTDAWAFTAAMRYSGKQYATLDNTDTVPHVYQAFDGFTVVDLRARYLLTKNATVNLGIDNVGDTKYTLFHPFPGRTYVADVRVNF
jgi:iron complex outermembrane receptor protein